MESMPYTLFYVPDIKQGAINYQNETVVMSIETYLRGSDIWTLSIERALQTVYDGLNATGRKDTWQLGNWPQRSVTDLNVFVRRSKKFSVVFELVNSQNKVIGKQTLQAEGFWGLNWRGRPNIEISSMDRKTLHFQNVNANDITDRMTIRVASVNGADAEIAAIDGVLQIRTLTEDEVAANDAFKFVRGEVQGFARRQNVPRGQLMALIIPEIIWGEPVASIGTGAFRNVGLGTVTIPNSVRFIGGDAFSDNSLERIIIGANVAMTDGNPFQIRFLLGNSKFINDNFRVFYRENGMMAGAYSLRKSVGILKTDGEKGGKWSYENQEGQQKRK